jgi:hypothetical protein
MITINHVPKSAGGLYVLRATDPADFEALDLEIKRVYDSIDRWAMPNISRAIDPATGGAIVKIKYWGLD